MWPAQRPVVGVEAGRRPVARPAIAQPAGPPVLSPPAIRHVLARGNRTSKRPARTPSGESERPEGYRALCCCGTISALSQVATDASALSPIRHSRPSSCYPPDPEESPRTTARLASRASAPADDFSLAIAITPAVREADEPCSRPSTRAASSSCVIPSSPLRSSALGSTGRSLLEKCDRAAARRRPQHDLAGSGASAGLPGGSSGVSLASTSMLLALCSSRRNLS